MKILITGAAGFLGQYLVDLFSRHELITIVRPTSDVSYLKSKGVSLVCGDLRDPECITEAAQGVDVIIHAAAALRGTRKDFEAINVDATRNLLQVALDNKVKRFVFISSIIVYDHSVATGQDRFAENMEFEQLNQTNYCRTKIAAERLVGKFNKEHGLATTILRPGAIFGKRGPLFISRLGFAAGSNRYVIVGKGRLPLPLSSVEGVARAVKLSIEKDVAVGQVYNVIEDEAITQNEYFNEVRSRVIKSFSTIKLPYGLLKFVAQWAEKGLGLVGMASPLPLSYMKLCVVPFCYSNEKIKAELGWQPCEDFLQHFQAVMNWHGQARMSKRKLPDDDHRVRINSDKKLRVGIVGCGIISDIHLKALRNLKNAAVVALCDPAEEARMTRAAKYMVKQTYAGYQEMLQAEELDVVHVCTPAQTHAEVSIAAMKKGCHVLVEKPFASTADEAVKMVKTAERCQVKLCVDHNHLFDRVMIKARNTIASGALGELTYVESWYGTSYSSDTKSRYLTYEAKNNWAFDMPGSLYQNFISHPISLLLDVMGEAQLQSVHAKFHRIVPHMPTDELRVAFTNKEMMGLLNMSMAVSPRYLFVNIYGTKGTLKVDLLNKTVFLDRPGTKLPRVVSRSLNAFAHAKILLTAAITNMMTGLIGRYNMYQGNETLIRLFYRSILEDTPSPVSGTEGIQSMEIMDQIWSRLAEPVGGDKDGTKEPPSNGRKNLAKNGPVLTAGGKV